VSEKRRFVALLAGGMAGVAVLLLLALGASAVVRAYPVESGMLGPLTL
jgi:hypothetical protein